MAYNYYSQVESQIVIIIIPQVAFQMAYNYSPQVAKKLVLLRSCPRYSKKTDAVTVMSQVQQKNYCCYGYVPGTAKFIYQTAH
jgi:hypothetical protein